MESMMTVFTRAAYMVIVSNILCYFLLCFLTSLHINLHKTEIFPLLRYLSVWFKCTSR
jgi:hypothetical protein